MTKTSLIRLAGAACLALAVGATAAAQWSAGAAQTQAGARPTWDDLAHSHWIADGRDDAPRKVYVFLDANCIYCAKFWADARPWVDDGKVQLRYLMVAVIAPTSAGKAATLLADPDPARRLAAFERSHAFGVARMLQGGPHASMEDASLAPTPVSEDVARFLEANQGYMTALNLRGTPGLVFRGLDGRAVAIGGIPAAGLESVFGAR
jgi:thiol:disulfide interchange protein DsbG